MTLASNALCAKAKAMYGSRIKKEEYQEMCTKKTVQEVTNYLNTQTNYSLYLDDSFENLTHRYPIELALKDVYYKKCLKLIKYAPQSKKEFYLYPVIKIEIDLIIYKIQTIKTNTRQQFQIPIELERYLSFNIYHLYEVKSYENLVLLLEKTRYSKILKKYENSNDLSGIRKELNFLFYGVYFELIDKYYKGKTKKDLQTIIYTSIELKNIANIYRLKKYFNASPQEIRNQIYIKHNRIPKYVMEEIINAKDAKEVMKILSNSQYHLYVDDDEFVYIEYYIDQIKYNIAKRHMRFSNNSEIVYTTYSVLLQIELENVIHIIEGIRYNKDPKSIEETLIFE